MITPRSANDGFTVSGTTGSTISTLPSAFIA